METVKGAMATPRFRHWTRTSGPRVVSGMAIVLGILIVVITRFLKTELSEPGFRIGMTLALLGLIGVITIDKPKPG